VQEILYAALGRNGILMFNSSGASDEHTTSYRKWPLANGVDAMRIAVASDHRGLDSKEEIKAMVTGLGHECIDFGTCEGNPVDYPDLAFLAATAVTEGRADRAILVCATGLGMSIAANKVKGIRAAACHDEMAARIAREQKDANVLCVSGEIVGRVLLRKIVGVWLETEFTGGRHQRRIDKIRAIEEGRHPAKPGMLEQGQER
jgi:ribose 5-phosphate isomerase B